MLTEYPTDVEFANRTTYSGLLAHARLWIWKHSVVSDNYLGTLFCEKFIYPTTIASHHAPSKPLWHKGFRAIVFSNSTGTGGFVTSSFLLLSISLYVLPSFVCEPLLSSQRIVLLCISVLSFSLLPFVGLWSRNHHSRNYSFHYSISSNASQSLGI